MIAILIGVIFFGQELNQDGVMNMNGAIFLFLTNMTFQNVFSVINVGFRSACIAIIFICLYIKVYLYFSTYVFLKKIITKCFSKLAIFFEHMFFEIINCFHIIFSNTFLN